MSRIKQMVLLAPTLVGKKIKIFTEGNSYWAVAEVIGYTGMYLQLKNVEIWNGMKKDSDTINAQWIKKIEIV